MYSRDDIAKGNYLKVAPFSDYIKKSLAHRSWNLVYVHLKGTFWMADNYIFPTTFPIIVNQVVVFPVKACDKDFLT